MDFSFLKSLRFWSLVVGAVVLYLKAKGWIGVEETALIETILGGFIAIRTVDRVGEKIGGQ
jgi:hypothetical protein